VEQLDRGGQGDAFLRRDVEAFGQPEAEAGPDAFARTFEKIRRGLAESSGSAGCVGE
jgi:hypothetical protein